MRPLWAETVARHEDTAEEHGKTLQRLDELTSNTSETVFREQGRLQDCVQRLTALERWREEANPIILEVEARAASLAKSVQDEFDAARLSLKEQTEKNKAEFLDLKAQVEGGLHNMAVELPALEARTKGFTTAEV